MTLAPDLLSEASDQIRPEDELSPSEFAERYRVLHPVYCIERPGRWSNDVFPFQRQIMDMVEEAIDTGLRGVALMKSGQGGGTDLMINGACWLKHRYPGPMLFMTSIEDVADEFGRERFASIIPDMTPLARKYRPTHRGDNLTFRFTDGRIQLVGGQSIFKLESSPYRHVILDELDSLPVNLGGKGDPLSLAENRTEAFSGQTLLLAYAHPTTKERGVAKLYFEQSDQRRGFVQHRCGHEFWLQWAHVQCRGDKSDPGQYAYVCPGCGREVTDPQRVGMVRNVAYKSVLAPEEASRRRWIGAHFSQLYYPARTIRQLAQKWIGTKFGESETENRVWVNKTLGEPEEPKVQAVSEASLRALICVKRRANDPEFYLRGQVPPGVRFLTAGQDSRNAELHYSVWGWGLRRLVDETTVLCAWLIDWGVIARDSSPTFTASEYHVFDDLIYRRRFLSADGRRTFGVAQCGHDIGWGPTQIPLVEFIRSWPNRAFCIKGAALEPTSAVRADYMRIGNPIAVRIGDETIRDDATRPWLCNTYQLKCEWYGSLDKRVEVMDVGGIVRKVPLVTLPEDVDDSFVQQSAAEFLGYGQKPGERVWKHKGPNHYADCNTYAHGLALNLNPAQAGRTDEEQQEARQRKPARASEPREYRRDPSLG